MLEKLHVKGLGGDIFNKYFCYNFVVKSEAGDSSRAEGEVAVMEKLEKVTFHPEGADPVDFYVLEQTRIGGFNYILVSDSQEGDGEALILKDLSQDGEEESVFTVVSDDDELTAVAGVFEDMLEDIEFER